MAITLMPTMDSPPEIELSGHYSTGVSASQPVLLFGNTPYRVKSRALRTTYHKVL